jgi:hypothetical protein
LIGGRDVPFEGTISASALASRGSGKMPKWFAGAPARPQNAEPQD